MKLLNPALRKAVAALPLLCLVLALPAGAQQQQKHEGARLKLDSLDKFAAVAVEAESKEEPTKGGDGKVYVRRFKFKEAGAYNPSDLEAIREQLRGPGWSLFMKVKESDDEPDENENVEIYVFGKAEGSKLHGGMTIISTQAKEFAVVNIVGAGSTDDLPQRGGAKKPSN